MYKTQAEALEFLEEFMPSFEQTPLEREAILCVPFTALSVMSQKLHGTRVQLGAQNVHWEGYGAYTGEISGPMLTEIGVRYVVIGHSERRKFFGDTDTIINMRLKAAQAYGLIPILCVGETKLQRDAGETQAIINSQLEKDLEGVDQEFLIIAYEPIWAIGSGDTCNPAEANQVLGAIRGWVTNPNISLQYGGSVNHKNIDEIMAQPEIDGVLVGGASLQPTSFARIVNYQD